MAIYVDDARIPARVGWPASVSSTLKRRLFLRAASFGFRGLDVAVPPTDVDQPVEHGSDREDVLNTVQQLVETVMAENDRRSYDRGNEDYEVR